MLYNLNDYQSIGNQYVAELRDVLIQKDRMRFRKNLERLGQLFAIEISKGLEQETKTVETPLGSAEVKVPKQNIVLATILRAGLPFHQGFLDIYDGAENAFVSAYRHHHKNGSFEINIEYISSPMLEDKVLILCDPMLASGASLVLALTKLLEKGKPNEIHIATAIASRQGLNRVQRLFPKANIWVGAIDEELTAKSYIVPGLGDAGDLAYGTKT